MSREELDDELESSERVQRLSAFTLGDFVSIIARLGSDKPCEACGSSRWFTPAGEDNKPVMLKMAIFDSSEQAVQLYVPRFCAQCANTRFFNVGWLLDGIPKPGVSDEQQ